MLIYSENRNIVFIGIQRALLGEARASRAEKKGASLPSLSSTAFNAYASSDAEKKPSLCMHLTVIGFYDTAAFHSDFMEQAFEQLEGKDCCC